MTLPRIARSIIEDVCIKHNVTREALHRNKKGSNAVGSARREAITRMRDYYEIDEIAEYMNLHHVSICYHLYPKRRALAFRNAARQKERDLLGL